AHRLDRRGLPGRRPRPRLGSLPGPGRRLRNPRAEPGGRALLWCSRRRMMESLTHYTNRAASLSFRNQCWIDGRFVPAAKGARFESVNPATAEVLTDVARGDAEDIDRAVAAARRAFEDGRCSRKTPGEREEVLRRAATRIAEN